MELASSRTRTNFGVATAALLIGGTLAAVTSAGASAEIVNNEPTQAYASIVTALNSNSTTAPRYITTVMQPSGAAPQGAAVTFGDAVDPVFPACNEYDGTQTCNNETGHTILNMTTDEVGTIAGTAWSSGTNPSAPSANPKAYFGAFVKETAKPAVPATVSMPSVLTLPGGAGQVWVYDLATGTLTELADVPNAGTPTTSAEVSKAGLGDLELDPAERYLYTVNMFDKQVYRADTWAVSPSFTQLGDLAPVGTARCPTYRPFGLKVTALGVYVGSTCETVGQLDVLFYDFATSAWQSTPVLTSTPTDTARLLGLWDDNGTTTQQFVASSIDFAADGTMYVGLRSRRTDILMDSSGLPTGRVFSFAPSGANTWSSTETIYPIVVRDGGADGPGGHVVTIPGTATGAFGSEFATTVRDPFHYNSGGVAWFSSAGSVTSRERIYWDKQALDMSFSPTEDFFGKSNGLGDLEVLAAWREIGNRAWIDTDSDGVQDVGEPDATGVVLELLDATGTTVLATVTTGTLTAAGDNYRFYVNPHVAYQVRVAASNFASGGVFATGGTYAGLAVTTQDAIAGGADADSDANPTTRVIAVVAAGVGDVNYTYDVGFSTPVSTMDLAIAKSVTSAGPYTSGATVTYALTVTNNGPSAAAAGYTVTDVMPAGITATAMSGSGFSCVVATLTCTSEAGLAASTAAPVITVTGTIDADVAASTALKNVAFVQPAAGDIAETNVFALPTLATDTTTSTTNNDAEASITTPAADVADPILDVSIAKSTSSSEVRAGSSVSFDLVVTNGATSNIAAVNPRVTDPMPVGLLAVSASGQDWSCETSETLVDCTYNGSIAPGASSTITVLTTVSALAGSMTNVATVSVSGDTISSNNLDDATVVISQTELPRTGADSTPVLLGAGGLIAAGFAMVLAGRRRRRIA